MNKHRRPMRIKAFLLALIMTAGLLPVFRPTAAAAGGYDDNLSLKSAIDSVLTPAQLANPGSVFFLNLAGKEIFGDVDVAALKSKFVNLASLDLSHTNVAAIDNAAAIPSVTAADTFADGTRSFVVQDASAVEYLESSGEGLRVSDLLGKVMIGTAGGNLAIAAGMLETGSVTLTAGAPSPGSFPYPGVSPDGVLARDDILAKPAGSYTAALSFPVAYSDAAGLSVNVKLQIKKSGYVLTPGSGEVYDGGTAEFVLTRLDENGVQTLLEQSDGYYDIQLFVNADHNLTTTPAMSEDGRSMRISVTASELGDSTSAELCIYRTGTESLLASAEITKYSNEPISAIRFVEYNEQTVAARVDSGEMISAKGGTAITSKDPLKVSGDGGYTSTTVYLLEGEYTSGWGYIPERYKGQTGYAIGAGCLLSGEIVAVPNPGGGGEKILALVVTAKTSANINYSYSVPGSEPVKVLLENAGAGVPVEAYLNVQVYGNDAVGYIIYQVPEIYRDYTRAEIEAAVAEPGEGGVRMVAHYRKDAENVWHEIDADGAVIVEDSGIYLVAAAYYEEAGQAFLVPDNMIAGWYDDSPAGMFGSAWAPVGDTSMQAALNTSAGFAADTVVLEVRTDGYGQTVDPETDGRLVFFPAGDANTVEISITKQPKEVVDYILAPAGYALSLGGADIREELERERLAGAGRLFELNVLGQDSIAIGGSKDYEVWAVYSNYSVQRVSVSAADVALTSPVSPPPVTVTEHATGFSARAAADGGGADALAGTETEMTYSDGRISSRTVTVTIGHSEINGLYLVFEDYLGNLYSSAEELYGNFSDIGDMSGIGEPSRNFQIPRGTSARVYAVFAFGNDSFFEGAADWRAYIADAEDVSLMHGANIAGVSGDRQYSFLRGDAVSADNAVSAVWAGGDTAEVGGVEFKIAGAATGGADSLDVIHPVITGIYADHGGPVANGAELDSFIVGDTWDTAPMVRLSGNTGDTAISDAANPYTGAVTLIPGDSGCAEVTGYALGFTSRKTGLTVSYEYTYTVNGQTRTVTLPGVASPAYEVTVNIGHPAIEKIYLAARGNDTLTRRGGAGYIAGAENEYTLPYAASGTVRFYPVAMNSLTRLDGAFTAPDAVGEAEVAARPEYYSYLRAADFTPGSPWSVPADNARYIDITGAGVDGDGYIYYEIQFVGEVTYDSYLEAGFDISALALASGAPYSGLPVAADAADTLQIYHLRDQATAYAVDIAATEVNPAAYSAGDTVMFDIEYTLSAPSDPLTPDYNVPATFFNTGALDVMPGRSATLTGGPVYTAGAQNALRLEELGAPASGSYTWDSGKATDVPNSRLYFRPSMAGTYRFKLYTVNNANVQIPNYGDMYREITFTVQPYTGAQKVYYGKTTALNVLPALSGWTDIEEDGTGLLDAAALRSGILQMTGNTDGTATVRVKAGAVQLAAITVTTVSAAADSAALNVPTGVLSPRVMADGEAVALYWVVRYRPSDGSGDYTLLEDIDGDRWVQLQTESGRDLILDGRLVTAAAGSESGLVIYQATYPGTPLPTDEQFWAMLDNTRPPAGYHYEIRSGGVPVTEVELHVGGSAALEVWDLDAGAAVAGIETADSDNPVAVSVSEVSGGTFKVNALSAGVSTVTVYPSAGGAKSVTVRVTQAPAGTYTVSGRVTDGTSPVAGVTVTLGGYPPVTTDAAGLYAIGGVAPGNGYTLTASKPGYTPDPFTRGDVNVAGENVTVPDIVLTAALPGTYSVSGRVTDGTSPIAGAVVTLGGKTVTTGADGSFTIGGIPDGSYTLTVSRSGFRNATVGGIVVSGADKSVGTVTMTAASSGGGGGSGGTGGGGGASPSYRIEVTPAAGGAASADRITAAAGTVITVTAIPDAGYEITGVTVETAAGASVAVTDAGDGRYTFRMPAANVTVTAEFRAEGIPPERPSAPYTDVGAGQWYTEYIDYVLRHGIMQGTGGNTFEPHTNLSRAMLVQILYNLEDGPESAGGAAFDDVPADAWFADAVAWAASNGLVTGYGDGRYGPNDSVTREQMATILYRYAGYKDYGTQSDTALDGFEDAGDVAQYAAEAMRWAVGSGLINGRDGARLVPAGTATRAEVAAIITRLCRMTADA